MIAPRLLPTIHTPVEPLPRRCGQGQAWSALEMQVLRERYLEGGPYACLPYLPARNVIEIRAKARAMGLRHAKPYQAQRPTTPELDAAIRELYATGRPPNGAMAKFSRRWGHTRQWVRMRAIQLGAVTGGPARVWTLREDAVLREHQGHGTRYIQKALYAIGVRDRTEPAIGERMRKLGMSAAVDHGDALSASGVAQGLGIDVHAVLRWIHRGALRARVITTDDGTPTEYQVGLAELRQFLIDHPTDWHPGKAARAWLIDVLTYTEQRPTRPATRDTDLVLDGGVLAQLPAGARCVLVYVAWLADRAVGNQPPPLDLRAAASRLGYQERHLQRMLTLLEHARLISRVSPAHAAPRYRVTVQSAGAVGGAA